MKVKITSANRTQQVNVIAKCRSWGAGSRYGDYGPVDGKTAVGPGLKRVKATVEDVNRYQKEGVLYGWDGVSVAIIRVK